jgi:hypothetical protein
VTIFRNYGVDGRALILLDEEDFENLYITNRVHIRKIQVGRVAACSGFVFRLNARIDTAILARRPPQCV